MLKLCQSKIAQKDFSSVEYSAKLLNSLNPAKFGSLLAMTPEKTQEAVSAILPEPTYESVIYIFPKLVII